MPSHRAGARVRSALAKAALGLTFWALGAGVALGNALTDGGVAEPSAGKPGAAGQTLRESEPPPVVGDTFDTDAALPSAARAVASYTLRARLDAAAHTVSGEGTLTWTNASSRPAPELYFHLYLNAFKNSESVFLRSAFSGNRSGRGAKVWGTIDVKKLSVREMGGENVWPASATTPDDARDETDIRVPLPRPVAPGETISVDMEWKSQLPAIVERTGFARDFHMVAQWFPKVARREQDGTWAHFPFHAESEFYADFGAYDVTLDVPGDSVVGATGSLAEERTEGGRRICRYRASDVHDFAFTAWRGFRVRKETVLGVRVRLLVPPGHDRNAERTLSAVRHGLAHYGRAFGRYPYPTLTVVHPPEFAPAASGMEYPTLITTGAPWYAGYLSSFVERLTLHELGHQWFYGLVATDEHSFPFLDEGLTTFAESSAMKAMFGVGNGLSLGGLRVDGEAYFRNMAVAAGQDDVVARPASAFATFDQLAALVYARTDVTLETIARVYGASELGRALSRYARRYRFEHPLPKHLLSVVRETVGEEAAEELHAALLEGGFVDFVAKDLRTTRVLPESGIFDRQGKRETKDPPRTSERWASRVIVHRHGTLRLPVDVEIHFEDGSHVRKHWDARERWRAFEVEGSSRAVLAIVDPEHRVLLDENLSNNSVSRTPSFPFRTTERALVIAELLLGAIGP